MPFSLPYYRDASQLPEPLPDQNEIAQATPLPKASDYRGRLVVVRDTYVVKYGPLIMENEGYALLFVEERLNIPAPRLYAMYRNEDTLYIVMEYIRGPSLGTVWPSLTEANKKSITGELRRIFNQMGALPSPGFYGSVNGGPVPHMYFWSLEKDPAITGPFRTAEEFARAIALRAKANRRDGFIPAFHSDYLARHLPSALGNYPPRFTQGDLYRENVLVRKVVNSGANDEYEVAALVDWETAGWYPSYWEYAQSSPYCSGWTIGPNLWRRFSIPCRWRAP